jgi:electron transport complex protein RnfD
MSTPRFTASSSPHLFAPKTVPSIMRDVVIALIPATAFGVYRFGFYSLYVVLAAVFGTVATEYIGHSLMKRPMSVGDWSAVVSGVLIGLGCPPYVPLWLPFLGGVFAMAIVKLPFGGLGHNFLNPALAARAFLMASWPDLMTQWTRTSVAAVSSATPLAAFKIGQTTSYADMFFGNIPGSIGEISKLMLLIGFVYLLVRRIVVPTTPFGFIMGLFAFGWIFGGHNGLFSGDGLFSILSGGALMGAFFMCSDYVTSPITPKGQVIMGIGAGAFTALIRAYGSYAEGVTYAILFLNVVTPLIDKFVRPKAFGEAEKRAQIKGGKR